jgi:plasmid stabilization system protein ParE
MRTLKIQWTIQAQASLKTIYLYHKENSSQGANKLRNEIFNKVRNIRFAQQYQVDEINPKYRRIIVRHYKILYQEIQDTLWVMDLISTRQSPEVIKKR